MKFSKILLSSIVLSASIGSAFACELENGYNLPKDIEFDYDCEFEDGLSVVYKDNEDSEKVRYGYVDKKGKLVIPTVYNEAYAFAEGFGLVKKGDKTYFIKPDGKIAFDVSDNDENHAFSEGYAVAKKMENGAILHRLANLPLSHNTMMRSVLAKAWHQSPKMANTALLTKITKPSFHLIMKKPPNGFMMTKSFLPKKWQIWHD